MAEQATEPLLDNEAELGWEDVESLSSGGVTERCTVQALLEEHEGRGDVLKHLQTKGVVKLGELSCEDKVVLPAFGSDPLLTFGSDQREVDYEREWQACIQEVSERKQRSWLRRLGRRVDSTGWNNSVGLEAFVVTLRGAAWPGKDGIIQPLLKRWQARSCSFAVFSLPAVQAVIKYKWQTFGRRLLQAQLVCFLLWLISFNVFIVAFEDEDLSLSFRQMIGTARGRVAVVAELLALLFMAPFLVLEAGTVSTYGWHFLDAWNRLDWATYALEIGITIMHLSRAHLRSSLLSNMLALQCILLLFRLQYFSQVFRPSRFSFLSMVEAVVDDCGPYIFFMILIMYGFGSAFYILFRSDDNEEFSTIYYAFLSMFEHQYGDLALAPMYKSNNPASATALALLYILIQGTVIINLILGIVIQSLDRVMEQEVMRMLLNQARVIDELESSMPAWLLRWGAKRGWFPSFVHVARINPAALDAVDMDRLWTYSGKGRQVRTLSKRNNGGEGEGGSGSGSEEGGSGEAKGNGHAHAEAQRAQQQMAEQLAQVQAALQRQEQLLRTLCSQQGVVAP